MRSTRNQPFCWQEKKVFRILREEFSGNELVKLRCLYGAITEADSDFNSQDIKYYTKTIHTYSGLSKDWIPTGLKILEDLHVLRIIEDRENGKFKGKRIKFTPEEVKEVPRKTIPGKPGNGKSFNGNHDTSEDILLSEDSNCKEDNKENLSLQDYSFKAGTLCKSIEDSFILIEPFTDYAIERKAIKRIAGYIYKDAESHSRDPCEYAHDFMESFYSIYNDKRHFLHTTPFKPSAVSYNVYQRIIEATKEKTQELTHDQEQALAWLMRKKKQ